MRLLTSWVESSDKEMAGSKPTVPPVADKLAKYIKEMKAKARLEKVMKRLEDIQKNANGNEARLPRKTRAKQRKNKNK